MAASRDLRVTLIGEDRTGGAFGSAGKNASGMGSKFAAVGKAAAVAVGGAAIGFGLFAKNGVDAFARVEDATGAAGVQFGKASADVVKFAQSASTSFGLSTGAALDAANTFGTMGKAAGLSGQNLAKFSTDFTGLAGDMASFKGTSPEQAIEAIGAALRGETEPIRAYGVLLDDASLRQEALSQGLIKTTKQALTPQQKVLAAQSLIYKQTGDAQGDFQRTSDSTANTAKRLAAETENASAKLGQQLAPAATFLREKFLQLIQSASGFVTVIGPAISAFAESFKTGEVSASGFVGKVQEVGAFIGQTLIPALQDFGRAAIPVVVDALVNAGDAFAKVGEAALSVVKFFREHQNAARALGVVVAAVAAAVAAAWVAQAVVATTNAVRSVVAWATTATASTTSATIQSKSTAQIAVGWAASAAAAAANAVRHVAAWVLMGTQALLNAARVAAAWLIAMGPIALVIAAVVGLAVVIVKNWDKIKQVIGAGWDWVKAKTVAVWDRIKAALSAVFGAIQTAISTYFNAYKTVVTTVLGAISGAVSAGWSAIRGAFTSALGAIGTAVSTGFNAVVAIVTAVPRRILGALGNLGSLLVIAGRELMSGLARGIGEKIASVVNKVKDAAQKIKDLLPGSPVKDGPLTAWNNGGAGKRLMEMLEGGIASKQGLVSTALRRALDAGDLAGMSVGGTGYVTSRMSSTAASAPVEPSGDSLIQQLIAEVRGLRGDIQSLPRDYQMGRRAADG